MSAQEGKPLREWLAGKTAADFDLIEAGGRIFFPDVVHRVRSGGKFEETPVLVAVPRPVEKAAARREALTLFAKWKLDREKDGDLFDMIDKFAILARAIRTRDDGHGQAFPLEWLLSDRPDEGFEERSLWAVWERMKAYENLIDPAITEPDEEEVIAAAQGIARVRNLSPLAVISGPELDSFVVCMATILCTCLARSPSSPSTGN